jgi:hypothetical protein
MHASLAQSFAPPRQPILRLWGLSVDATMAILLTQVAMMLVLALQQALHPQLTLGQYPAPGMIFHSQSFRLEEASRLFLYAFRHDLISEHLFFVVEMILLFFCGRGLENQIGTKAMVFYYGTMVIVSPLLLLAWSRWTQVPVVLESSFHLTVVLCLSYLLVMPQQRFYEGWHLGSMTWLMLGFCVVFFLARQEWARLATLVVMSGLSLLYLESIGAGKGAGILYLFRSWPVPPSGEMSSQQEPVTCLSSQGKPDNEFQDSVDRLLEKISQQGMDSLTAEERCFLTAVSKQRAKNE